MRQLSTLLAAAVASVLTACSTESGAAIGTGEIPFVAGQASAEKLTAEERDIAKLAIDTLAADLKVGTDRILVDAVLAVEWRDSSMGCPKPGMAYLQAITPGHKITLRADGIIHVVNEANGRAIVCHQTVAGDGYGGATLPLSSPPCESARVLKVRTLERAEGAVAGPTPPTEEGAPRPSGTNSSPIYYVSLECDGRVYVARVAGGTPGFDPEELGAATSLHLRADDGKVFLKSEQGAEFEAILAAVPPADDSPPR